MVDFDAVGSFLIILLVLVFFFTHAIVSCNIEKQCYFVDISGYWFQTIPGIITFIDACLWNINLLFYNFFYYFLQLVLVVFL